MSLNAWIFIFMLTPRRNLWSKMISNRFCNYESPNSPSYGTVCNFSIHLIYNTHIYQHLYSVCHVFTSFFHYISSDINKKIAFNIDLMRSNRLCKLLSIYCNPCKKNMLWKRTFACIFEMAFIVLSIISAKKIEQKITENIVFTKSCYWKTCSWRP